MKHAISASRLPLKAMIFALLWVVVGPPDLAFAKIYKYTDDQGKTHFTDSPNSIPLKYRKKNSLKKFKEIAPSPDAATSSPGPKGTAPKGTAGSGAGPDSAGQKDEGLDAKQVQLVKKSIKVLQKGVALAERYKGAVPNFPNGQGAVIAIQNNLPEKQSLTKELAGTKVKALLPVQAFLQQSVATDKETRGIGAGIQTRIMGILNRIQSEGQKQAAFIKQLEQALKDSEKKKAEVKAKAQKK